MLLLERPSHDRWWSKLRRSTRTLEGEDGGQSAMEDLTSTLEVNMSRPEDESTGLARALISGMRLIPLSWHRVSLFDEGDYVKFFGRRPTGL